MTGRLLREAPVSVDAARRLPAHNRQRFATHLPPQMHCKTLQSFAVLTQPATSRKTAAVHGFSISPGETGMQPPPLL
ncbi:hypothetical protein [Alicyclobacillus contaminans]|uniref:hypothetical protein n=1 Tax=Alicyclobacillus contaminans TaxID=392016 RepID=UPI00146FC07A|nr:hypothetical protein [Alicyclobacillus contaminans]